MIALKPATSNLDIPALSLSDILFYTLHSQRYPSNGDITYSYPMDLQIKDPIGNANLQAADLIYYPALAKALRKLPCYPHYNAHLSLSHLEGIKDQCIKGTINALHALQDALAPYRQEKATLDAEVNNLIMLHGQQKTMPIYNGSKPHYIRANYTKHKRRIGKHFFYLSGVRYFSQCRKPHTDGNKLYNLMARTLTDTFRETNTTWQHDDFVDIGDIAGGIINTPIIMIRCARSRYHKGRLFYLDLHTQTMYSTKAQARSCANQYTTQHYFDAFEDRQ